MAPLFGELGDDYSPRRAAIGASVLGVWDDCPRKFLFKERLGLVRKEPGKPPDWSIVGWMFHKWMEYLLTQPTDRVGELMDQYVRELVADSVPPEVSLGNEGWDGLTLWGEDYQAYQKRVETHALPMTRVLAGVAWAPLKKAIGTRYKVLGTELQFNTHTPYFKAPLQGTLDLLLLDTQTNELWICDHKTTSDNPLDRCETLLYEPQPYVYRLGVAYSPRLNPDRLPVVGFIHNVVRKPTIRFCGKDADYEAYALRCKDWYEEQAMKGTPAMVHSWIKFGRGDEMPVDLRTRLAELSHACNGLPDTNTYYRRSSACQGRYGGRGCRYKPICTKPLGLWARTIREGYRQEFRYPTTPTQPLHSTTNTEVEVEG